MIHMIRIERAVLVLLLLLSTVLADDLHELVAALPLQMDAPINWSDIQTAQVGDVSIAYKSFGQGPPIILITGYRVTMDTWDPILLYKLSEQYRVIVMDNRGMGFSCNPGGNLTIEMMAEDVAGLMDVLGISSAHILGWSMGGFVAQELALSHPEKVDKLILYGTGCSGGSDIPPDVWPVLTDTNSSSEGRSSFLIPLLLPLNWTDTHPDIFSRLPIPITTPTEDMMEAQAFAMESWGGSCERLDHLMDPTLVITGMEDGIIPPEHSLELVEEIPDSWLVRIPFGGHYLMYQFPEKMAGVVEVFLEG